MTDLPSLYQKHEYGPLDTFEIIWASGHIEHLDAHQVQLPAEQALAGVFSSLGLAVPKRDRGWVFHGEIDGHWRLLLTAPAEDIRAVRNVTHTNDHAGAPGDRS